MPRSPLAAPQRDQRPGLPSLRRRYAIITRATPTTRPTAKAHLDYGSACEALTDREQLGFLSFTNCILIPRRIYRPASPTRAERRNRVHAWTMSRVQGHWLVSHVFFTHARSFAPFHIGRTKASPLNATFDSFYVSAASHRPGVVADAGTGRLRCSTVRTGRNAFAVPRGSAARAEHDVAEKGPTPPP